MVPEKIKQEGPWFFHYGDHSNHPTMKLARSSSLQQCAGESSATALLVGDQVVIHRKRKEPVTVRIPVKSPHASVSLAVDEAGWAVVGTTARERADGQQPLPDRSGPEETGVEPGRQQGRGQGTGAGEGALWHTDIAEWQARGTATTSREDLGAVIGGNPQRRRQENDRGGGLSGLATLGALLRDTAG